MSGPFAVRSRSLRRLAAPLWLLLAGACDLTLTQEPLTYEELSPERRAAVDIIFSRLVQYDASLSAVSAGAYRLGPIATDHSRVNVGLDDVWTVTNLGDDRVHLTPWPGLSGAQQARWAEWFGETSEAAAARYALFFYHYLGLHLAGIQTVYAVQGVDWVYGHRSVFNVERDAERLVLNLLHGIEPSLLEYAKQTCGVILTRFDPVWGAHYSQGYYAEHFREMTDPADPSGYLYFLCRHQASAEARRAEYGTDFAVEVEMIRVRRNLEDETE